MRCEQSQVWITALVDNELSGQEREALHAHMTSCAVCARAYAAERDFKNTIKRATTVAVPAALRHRVEEKLVGAGTARRGESMSWVGWLNLRGWRPVFATAVVLISIAAGIYLRWPDKGVANAAIETHRGIVTGKTLLVRTDNPAVLRQQMARAVGERFAPIAFDFSTLGLQAVSGFAQKVGEREVLVTVYEGRGPTIICYTFLGSEADAPSSAERFYDADMKMNFYSYSRDGVNALLHREGNVICILTSKMAPADLLALLRGKSAHA